MTRDIKVYFNADKNLKNKNNYINKQVSNHDVTELIFPKY